MVLLSNKPFPRPYQGRAMKFIVRSRIYYGLLMLCSNEGQ